MAVLKNYPQFTGRVACGAIYFALFFLPFSRFFVNQALVLAVLAVLLQGSWRARWHYVWQFRFIKMMFAFIGLILLGIFYSHTSFSQAVQGFFKYAKLLFIPFFLPLFRENKPREKALLFFIAGIFCCIVLNTLHHYGVVNLKPMIANYPRLFTHPNDFGSFINPIPVSVLEAFACFVLLHKLATKPNYKIVYLILLFLISSHLFAINVERTGMLCYVFLLGLFFLQRLKWQIALLLCFIIVPTLLTGLYYKSDSFAMRIQMIHSDIAAFKAGHANTSIGLRFSFWLNSWPLIKQAPLLGTGTGSFQTVYAKAGGITADVGVPLSDPHNEFVLIAVQWGLIGLSLYLFWFAMQLWEVQRLPLAERRLAQGLITTILVSSLTHVTLYTNATGTLLVLGLCLFFAAKPSAHKL